MSTLPLDSPSFKFSVEIDSHGLRLDKFLSTKIQEVSRSRLQALVKEGCVKVNDECVHDASFKIKETNFIEIIIPPIVEARPSPENIPLSILYEDNDLIVINKPAGMVVHPAPGNLEGTLVNALLSHCGESLSGINGVKRPGIVHRLDKETSGLLVAAKHDKAHHSLSHQLATRMMGRRYWALVWGVVVPSEGTIEGSIGRDPRHRQRMAIQARGKFARTHYKVLKNYGRLATLVECRLETGRTHQIRVHMTAKGYPLIGDVLYGKQPYSLPSLLKNFFNEKWLRGRHALHAKELSFVHPVTQEKIHFSTDLPEDILTLINMLNLT